LTVYAPDAIEVIGHQIDTAVAPGAEISLYLKGCRLRHELIHPTTLPGRQSSQCIFEWTEIERAVRCGSYRGSLLLC
jgi:hypothetical protein